MAGRLDRTAMYCPACAEAHALHSLWPQIQSLSIQALSNSTPIPCLPPMPAEPAHAAPLNVEGGCVRVDDTLITAAIQLPHRISGIACLRPTVAGDDTTAADGDVRSFEQSGKEQLVKHPAATHFAVELTNFVSAQGFYSTVLEGFLPDEPGTAIVAKAYRSLPAHTKVSAKLLWHRELFVLTNLAMNLETRETNASCGDVPIAKCLGFAVLQKEKPGRIAHEQPLLILQHAGISLSAIIDDHSLLLPLGDSALLRSVASCLLQAILLASRCGFCHGDIKLSNVLVKELESDSPVVVLADWNSATPLRDDHGYATTGRVTVTDIRSITRVVHRVANRQATGKPSFSSDNTLFPEHLKSLMDILLNDKLSPMDRCVGALHALSHWPLLCDNIPLADTSAETAAPGAALARKRGPAGESLRAREKKR